MMHHPALRLLAATAALASLAACNSLTPTISSGAVAACTSSQRLKSAGVAKYTGSLSIAQRGVSLPVQPPPSTRYKVTRFCTRSVCNCTLACCVAKSERCASSTSR